MSNEINSKEYWEEYFKTKWEINRGREQTEYFMQLIIENLPENIKKYIDNSENTILDWGCALGQGVNLLQNKFPNAKVRGIDFSDTAIEEAKNEYQNLSFISGRLSELNEKFSVITCSNCLEHFADPKPYFKEHLAYTKDIYIALVPYREENLIESHEISLNEDFFPDEIESFRKIYSKILDTRSSGFWNGYQFLVIYANKSLNFDIVKKNDSILINSQSPQLWDNVAETYSETANNVEIKLGQEIEQLLLGLGIEPDASLLEVGCGSGHLSGYLAGKGFQTTLIDFSKVALEKAKKHYEQNNLAGNFVNVDMFDLSEDLVEPHDVVWNSGVLEHFDAWNVIDALKRMGQVARKYVVILVPNAKSIPYLLFRQQAMEKGEWIWGRELLRDSMKHLAEAADLEVIEEQYVGKHFSYDQFNYVNSGLGTKYQDIDQQLLPKEQNYLIALIARPKNKDITSNYEKVISNVLRKESKIETDTYYFDFYSFNSHREKKDTKIDELQNLTTYFKSRVEEKNYKIHELQSINVDFNSQLVDFRSQLEEKDNKIHELQSINVDFKSQVEDKNNKIKELQNTTAHFKFQLKDKNNRIKELQNITADFKSQFEEKSNDVLTLRETVRQRESSLSWKVSQFYGRYFEIDCLLSRSISKILNKLILTKNPKNTTDIFLNFDKESYKELNIMEDFKKFLDAGDNTHICLIFSGTKFVENEGQRPLRLAQEFSKKGYKIIFVGWRWNNKEQIDIGDVFPNVFQIPIDFLVNNYTEILSYSNPSIVNKLFISEFPHPLLFEILSVANSYNWVTIYDVLDDWEEFHKVGNAVWYDKEVESYVAFNSKIVTCVSPTLAEKIKNATNSTSIQVLPNAVSPDMLYTNINEKLPTFIKGKITIGYFGHLTPAWFDWDTVISIANRNPDWTFHIIGYGDPKELQIPNNILLIGKVDPSELGHYASNWDVAIIPFKESVLSSSVDPIKLYEYLFFNLPVVATGIYHIERYPYVWVAHSLNEFEASIIKASETKIEKDVIQKFISENSWSKRVDEIERYTSDLFNDGVRI